MTARIIIVSGTGTAVGKTIVTAGIASLAARSNKRVAVVKPGQTGVRGDDVGDVDDVRRLAGVTDVHELVRYRKPLAPAAAARIDGDPTISMAEVAETVTQLAQERDLVLIEGAGGFLVEYNEARETIADLAAMVNAQILIVVQPKLGTLNHTALTLESINNRHLTALGVVIGSWPYEPDLACRCNLRDLDTVSDGRMLGAVKEKAGRLSRPEFLSVADSGLAPALGGHFDAAQFEARYGYGGTNDN